MSRMDDLISRETMKDAIESTTWYHQNRNKDIVEGASDVETAWYKAEDVYKAIENVPTAQPDIARDIATILKNEQDMMVILQNAQPEITEEQVKEYCKKRCLVVLDSSLFQRLKSAQPEKCEDCGNFNKARLLIPQPERKRGKWLEKMRPTQSQKAAICECSVCGDTVWVYDGDRTWNYCPNCGARMEAQE